MNIFYYFREIRSISIVSTDGSETHTVDFNSLNLIERLAFSAYLTLKKNSKIKTYGQAMFGEFPSYGNYKEFDKVITHILDKYTDVLCWIDDNANKVVSVKIKDKTKKMPVIHAVKIDFDKIFALRSGKTGLNINSIAWRAWALAAATSKVEKAMNLRSISVFSYVDASITNFYDYALEKPDRWKIIYGNTTSIKNRIKKWCDAAGVKGHFEKSCFIAEDINQNDMKQKIELSSGPLFAQIEQQKKPKAELKAKPIEPEKEAEEEECKGVDKGFAAFCKSKGMTPELEIDMTSTKTTYPKNSVQWKIQNILNMDPVKFQNTRENLSSSAGEKGNAMIYDNILVKIYNKLSAIAKKYKISNRDDIKDHFTNGLYLKLPDYSCFIEDLKVTRNWAMSLLSDDEDSRILEDSNLRKLARLDFVKNFGWMLNIK